MGIRHKFSQVADISYLNRLSRLVWCIRSNHTIQLCMMACIVILIHSQTTYAANEILEADRLADAQQLESELILLADRFYSAQNNLLRREIKHTDDINTLYTSIKRFVDVHRSTTAMLHLKKHIELVRAEPTHNHTPYLIGFLLDRKQIPQAELLYRELINSNDKTLIANAKFEYARHYLRHNNWNKLITSLNEHVEHLQPHDKDYARIIYGIAQQKLNNHKLAIESYTKISPESTYYNNAQLNIAIANINIGDADKAETAIQTLTNKHISNRDNELKNKAHLILGYTLLHQQQYGKARKSFQNIDLKSRYKNSATLGIALSAIKQKDYLSGLNMLKLLTQDSVKDLPTDESRLLTPYVYKQLNQELAVTDSYNNAINYYQSRLLRLEELQQEHKPFIKTSFEHQDSKIIINNEVIDYDRTFPVYFLDNYNHLLSIYSINEAPELNDEINKLLVKYDTFFQHLLNQQIARRIKYLNVYLNQSRYGLALLFDNIDSTTP